MTLILKLLGGTLGPYIALAIAGVLAAAIGTATVQGLRLDHAKADLKAARAALVDSATGKPWQVLAVARGADLATCQGNTGRLGAAIDRQNDAVDAWKAEATRRSAQAAEAVRASRAATTAAEKRAASILAGRAGPDQCASAENLIMETIR